MSKVPFNKPALTYADQLQQLKERGLIIRDEQKALHLLESISYFRLSGYWYPMLINKENHKFKQETSFEDAFNIYKFDRELRLMILGEIEKIEIAFRAKIIYILSHNRGAYWHENPANFINPEKHKNTLVKIKDAYKRSDEQFIGAFKSKYINTLPPSWMILEIVSFGILSNLYDNFVPGIDKREIAKYFGIKDKTLSSWLHSIVYLRNICAHHSRLWNREMRIRPIIPKKPNNQWLENKGTPTNNSFFILSMIIYLMNTINSNHSIQKKFIGLLQKYPTIDISAMGFPKYWESEPLWRIKD